MVIPLLALALKPSQQPGYCADIKRQTLQGSRRIGLHPCKMITAPMSEGSAAPGYATEQVAAQSPRDERLLRTGSTQVYAARVTIHDALE